MKLYATITSERATKGQGGKYLHIEIFNESKKLLYSIIVEQGIGVYKGNVNSGSLVFYEELKAKRQKGEAIKCEWCKKRPATHKDWREIDGMTTSTRECDECTNIGTYNLIEKYSR